MLVLFSLSQEAVAAGTAGLPSADTLANLLLASREWLHGLVGPLAFALGAFLYYPSVVDPVQKVILLRDNYASMYLMHVLSFEFVALGLIIVTLALHQRLKELAPSTTPVATVVGLIRAGLLLASVMVFNYGMGAVVRLYATNPDQAVSAWQVIEPVAGALGGSGGEVLGGVWFLLLSAAGLRKKVFPRALNWLGVGIGTAGILSMVPALSALEAAFELLQICLLYTSPSPRDRQ